MNLLTFVATLIIFIFLNLNYFSFSQTPNNLKNTPTTYKKTEDNKKCTSTKEELLQEYREKYKEEYKDAGFQWSKWAYIIRRCELKSQKCECKYGKREKRITNDLIQLRSEFQQRHGEPFRYGSQRTQFGRMKADIEFENNCGCHGE